MKRVHHFLLFALCVAAGICWAIQRGTETQLRASVAKSRVDDGALERLRREHEMLQALLNGNRKAPATTKSDGGDADALREVGPSLRFGEWTAPADWKACGITTPEAAVESTLFAAVHGDTTLLKETLEFDDASIAKAQTILADLPESSRRKYASPEDLLSVVVAGTIPLDSAQLVARQENGGDDVTEYVRLKDSEGATRQINISLHRESDGWRLLLPANIVDRIRMP